jgi:thiosulfate dehydrogenase (quinone) large subunit
MAGYEPCYSALLALAGAATLVMVVAVSGPQEDEMTATTRRLLALVRIALGFTFLWAFVDKLFGLGFATKPENAWLAGGSPTYGFLTFGTAGPLAPLYQGMAGHPLVDALFMFGLFGLGTALLLGIGMKIAAVGGPLLMLMMWSAHLSPPNNPLIDDHIVFALIIPVLALAGIGKTWGLGGWWSERVGKVAPILE